MGGIPLELSYSLFYNHFVFFLISVFNNEDERIGQGDMFVPIQNNHSEVMTDSVNGQEQVIYRTSMVVRVCFSYSMGVAG